MTEYGRIRIDRRSGEEPFHDEGRELGFDLLSFWRWSASDIVSNTTRGVLAECLVARAIGASDEVRDEWATYDLLDPRGVTIQVKSAAYIQSWYQEQPSSISFACGETRVWDPDTNRTGTEKRRHAQVYVFALFHHMDQETLDPLGVSQWSFYVAPTALLDERMGDRQSVGLSTLRSLHGGPVAHSGLKEAVDAAGDLQLAEEAKAGR